MRPHELYSALQKQAAAAVLPYAIENPYEFAQKDTAGPAFHGATWGAGAGGLLGAAALGAGHGLGGAAMGAAGGVLFGGLLGASLGHASKVNENWNEHHNLVRAYEAEHGALPYELHSPRAIRDMARLKGRLTGMAADSLISGSPLGVSNRYDRYGYGGYGTNTYGLGQAMGAHYGTLSAQEQFGRALADYKRQMEQGR